MFVMGELGLSAGASCTCVGNVLLVAWMANGRLGSAYCV